jgi:RNA polymerase sigma-70 factor (ECF subfamily)
MLRCGWYGTDDNMRQAELVERASRGDRDAFDLLITDAIDRLYAMARLIVRDADLAEDAVQEALIHCWRELPRLRDRSRFDAWLHRLLVNAATDQYRRRRRYTAAVALIPESGVEADFAIGLAVADELHAAFERLRVEHRIVLVLYHYVGLSAPEIADVLGLPGGTVKSRLHYAAQAMRAAVDAGTRAPTTASTSEAAR